jgi:catechol 2,3-dioxygenase-like lactoylglutathione lyase family enzyme
MRLQLALNVKDLDAAIDFYSKLFGVEVNKRKPGYANFAIDEPPLKLVLFEQPDATERLNHLGVEVFEDEQVAKAKDRIISAGLPHDIEEETTCCYAKATKIWATEPDGARWEWYRVLADSETFGAPDAQDVIEIAAPGQTQQCCSAQDGSAVKESSIGNCSK